MKRKGTSYKATNQIVDKAFLSDRARRSIAAGYSKQKWVTFCEDMIALGFTLTLYEARKTFSKYVTVRKGERSFKVRFSNHRPIKAREAAGDCDFFVGVNNFGTFTTEDAMRAVKEFFITRGGAE